MAFFRNLHQNLSLPSVSSLVDTLSSAVDDLASVVGEVGYSVADSVTEQVTSMINGLRAEDESSKTQSDKPVEGREEHTPSLAHSQEMNMKTKRGAAEHKETHNSDSLDFVKKGTSEAGVSDHVLNKNQLRGTDHNNPLSDTEVPQDLKIVGGPFKREVVGGNECFVNDKFLKDSNLKNKKITVEQSIEEQDNCLYAVSGNLKNHEHKKIKPQSPGVDFKDSDKVHSMNVPQDLETKQKEKLSDSSMKKMHNDHPNCLNEIKEKKSEAFLERKRRPISKDEDSVSAAIANEGKRKNSKKLERELCNKKTAGKGEESVSKLHSSAFPETYDISYFFHLIYTFNNRVSCE
ncbi:PREDICTED: uncharacterized protein LOC106859867 [Sturnus vulgaris]|uniref:uncharacterized protein LOC106859867 n=1 Tax=Sturnus vulgaris TaxID=9172 RepID=UPI00071A76F8|nr:PREDICTED: uncharacterized protein LOC106859867 [Sturnus vulgaris]